MLVSKIRKSARDEDCSLRIPTICNFNPETTVLAHLNTKFKGMGLKSPDLFGVYACSNCHDVLDGRRNHPIDAQSVMDALFETQKKLIDKGLIKIL
jgi:hypothetical protein